MSSEYFALKDIPFNEVARLTDTEARQSHLDAREKKRQEGTLHQALGSTSWVTSSPTPRLAKKKTVVCPQVQEIVFKLNEAFEVEWTKQWETESIMPSIIEEVEEKKMVANLQVGFHEQ